MALAGCMSLAPKYERPAAPVAAAFPTVEGAASGPARPKPPPPWLAALLRRRPPAAADRRWRWPTTATCAWRPEHRAGARASTRSARRPAADRERWASAAAATPGERHHHQRLPGRPGGQRLRARPVRPRAQPERMRRWRSSWPPRKRARRRRSAWSPRSPTPTWPAGRRGTAGADQQTLKTREESLKLIQLRYDNGVVSKLDLQQAICRWSTGARAVLAQQQRQRAQDINLLTLLVGQPCPTTWRRRHAGHHRAARPAGRLPSDLLAVRVRTSARPSSS
jgi:multidrug efflux system outer membrane protein